MLSPGTIVSGYRVDGVLGEGGMGVVYRATQLSLNRTVALKILATDLTEDDAFRERFRREGLLQAAIDHQHIVTVYEAGETEHGLFLAMRLIRGPTLKSMIFAGELDPPRTLRILTQVAGALDAAHDVGLTHRDIKPQNILIGSDDHAYLADFGLTRASDEVSLTKTGQFIGTIDYVAPEQIQGMGGTAESDVYSLTAVLYEALTGVVPFLRMNEAAVLFAHLSETAPPATERNSNLPPEIDAVIARGMAKSPEDRYASAGELIADAIVAFGEDALAATSHAPPAPPPTGRPPEVAGAGEPTQARETLSGAEAAEAAMASTAARPTIPLPPEPAPAEPPALLAKHTTRELLKLRAAITRELLRRDEVHTANDPIGDIAEALVTEHYSGEGHGQQLEVKGIRSTGSRTAADLSPIPASSTYTDVVIVVFDDDLRVTEALRMPRSAVERLFPPRKKDGARVIRLSKKLRDDVDVVPIEISDALLDS